MVKEAVTFFALFGQRVGAVLPALFLLCACAVPAMAAPRPRGLAAPVAVTYVAIGASDAYGIGADDPERESWPAVLAGWLPGGSTLINLGVPGITLGRARDVELPIALDALATAPCPALMQSGSSRRPCLGRAGLVTVWLAVNDINDNVDVGTYAADLSGLLSTLRARTRATILVGNVPNLALLPAYKNRSRDDLAATVATWNRAIGHAARANGAYLVDLYGGWRAMVNHPEYVSADGFHPTTAGYRVLAQVFWRSRP